MYRKTYRLDPAPLRLRRSAHCEISMPDPRGETQVKAHKYFKSVSAALPSRSSLSTLTLCHLGSRSAMAAYRRPNPAVKSFTNNQTITVLTTKVWRSHRQKAWECLEKQLHIWAPSEEDQEGGGGGKEQQRHWVQPSQQSDEDGKEPQTTAPQWHHHHHHNTNTTPTQHLLDWRNQFNQVQQSSSEG